MKEQSNLLRIFTGSEVSVILLKGQLEENGIPAIVKNEFRKGITAGFAGSTPTAIDLLFWRKTFTKPSQF